MSGKMIVVDPDRMHQVARRLSNEGIWVKREFWVDETGLEVPDQDPRASTKDFVYEIDYDRIVRLVVDHLAHEEPDWLNDPNLSAEERLARFHALNPTATQQVT